MEAPKLAWTHILHGVLSCLDRVTKSSYPQYNVLGEVVDDAWIAPVPGSVSCEYNEYRMYAPDRDGGETCALCEHDCIDCPANVSSPE